MIRKARRFLSQDSGARILWNDQLAYFHLKHLVVANWRIKFRNEIWENSQSQRCSATDKQVQCWKDSEPVSSKRKLKIKRLIHIFVTIKEESFIRHWLCIVWIFASSQLYDTLKKSVNEALWQLQSIGFKAYITIAEVSFQSYTSVSHLCPITS